MLHASGRVMRESALDEAAHPALDAFSHFARTHDAFVLLGTLTLRTDDARVANRSLLLSPQGEVVARYDKTHMFDAMLPSGRVICESSTYRPGTQAVLAGTPWGALGLSICYDLRFPHLYRQLAQAGAGMLAVPSAFAASTGPAHWHALLRARYREWRVSGCASYLRRASGWLYHLRTFAGRRSDGRDRGRCRWRARDCNC
jgi:predicted amidohydrolase